MKRSRVLAAVVAGLTILAGTAPAVDQKLVQRAIERGVKALRAMQNADGTWLHAGAHEVGMTSLAGLTLVECGTKPDDSAVQKAAAVVRESAVGVTDTYSLALAILFLDRLDDAADVPLIQVLAIRLMHGQRPSGAWSYECPSLGGDMEAVLVARRPREEPVPRKDVVKHQEKDRAKELSPEIKELLATYAAHAPRVAEATQGGRPGRGFHHGGEDHSNTQFATLGLWVARRHGIPVDQALRDIDGHYRKCQNSEGGWGYVVYSDSTATMTAAGILGLAVGNGTTLDQHKRHGTEGKPAAGKDPNLHRALTAIASTIGQPLGQLAAPPGPAGGRRGRHNPGLNGPNAGTAFYFLWSLERVAMALGLETIGRKDWYSWGAKVLLASQEHDGRWKGSYWQGGADTCFALLFLVRSNLVKDLTVSLRGTIHDPGHVTLRSTGGPVETLPEHNPRKKPAIEAKPEEIPPVVERSKPVVTAGPAIKPSTSQPARPAAAAEPDATSLAQEIVRAAADQVDAILARLRDAKGVVNTEALAAAIPQLTAERVQKAREALAERLSRMRTDSLVNYLKDEDAEIRRGAALALAMKDSKDHVADVLALLGDPLEAVVLGARGALKELTGKDFGPRAGATAADRARALADWREWWRKNNAK